MGDNGQEVKPIEIYPTVEGLKVKPIITIKGTGRGVWIKLEAILLILVILINQK